MATPVIMPRQGQSVESCIIGEWHKKKGDAIKAGDNLFTYETDKATFDEVAKVDGELIAVFFAEGDDVPCLLNVCVIGETGEAWESYIPEGATQDGAGAAASVEAVVEPSSEPAVPAERVMAQVHETAAVASAAVAVDTRNMAISPRARNTAEKLHADLRFASGSGPNGRIIERDVKAAIAAGHVATAAAGMDFAAGVQGTGLGGRVRVEDLNAPAAEIPAVAVSAAIEGPEFEDVKLPNIRKVIAKAMHNSISSMAQLTLNSSFDATDVMAFRARIKKAIDAGLDEKLGFSILKKVPTFNDIVLYAVTRTVLQFPDCNAHFLDDKMRYFKNVNLGVAVDTPRGLMVPVIRNANKLTINEISAAVKILPQRLKAAPSALTISRVLLLP